MSKGWNNYSYLSAILFLVPLICSCVILSRLGAANDDFDGDSHFKVLFQLVNSGQRSDRAIVVDGINGGFKAYDCANRNDTTAPWKCISSPCPTFIYDADDECFCGRRYQWKDCTLNFEIENRCPNVGTSIDMYAIGCSWFSVVLLLSIVPHAASALVFWPSDYTTDRRHIWAFMVQAPLCIICTIFLAVGIHGADTMKEAECTNSYGRVYSLESHGYIEKDSVHVVRICASVAMVSQVVQLLMLICWRGYMAANGLEDGSSSDDDDDSESDLGEAREEMGDTGASGGLAREPNKIDHGKFERESKPSAAKETVVQEAPLLFRDRNDEGEEEVLASLTPVRTISANPLRAQASPPTSASPPRNGESTSSASPKRRLFSRAVLSKSCQMDPAEVI